MNRLTQALLLASLVVAPAAKAEMVSGGECLEKTHDCTCADAQYMELSLRNQEKALEAWQQTQMQIALGQASTFEEARALFAMNFDSDPRVLEPLSECTDLDTGKVAGTSILGGGAELNDCFCENVCKDIVDATITHERTHVAFNLLGISYIINVGVGCKADLLPADFCNASNALLLSESEIQAHTRGNDVLRDRLNELRMKDPEHPEMECTWEPLPAAQSPAPPPPQAPAGFFERVKMLAGRVFGGAQR
jgi:hypothetical protein